MIPAEIDWGPEGVRVSAWERDPSTFRRCLHKDCYTVLSAYNGDLYCWAHRRERR